MLEFEDVVYLDLQKTGSTYIRQFLREFVKSREIIGDKHKPVSDREAGKIYIISCRDPLQQYKSLYAYGCKGLGTFRKRLDRAEKGHLYDGTINGFSGWLELIIAPETSRQYLSGFDQHPLLAIFGVQTLRFLRLALPSYRAILDTAVDKEDIKTILKTHGLMDVILRQETLSADLLDLVSGPHRPRFKDVDQVEGYLETSWKLNTTNYMPMDLTTVSPEILSFVQQREWLFFETLGYKPYI